MFHIYQEIPSIYKKMQGMQSFNADFLDCRYIKILLRLRLEHIERLVSEDPENFPSLTEALENQYLFQFHAQYETAVNEDFHQVVTKKKLSLQKSYLGCVLSV